MVARLTHEPAALEPDPEPADGTDLSVEPVERAAGAGAGAPGGHARYRLRLIRLQLRVAALEAALARARRRRALVTEHYERILERRDVGDSPEFSWRD